MFNIHVITEVERSGCLSELEKATSFNFSKALNIGRPLYGTSPNISWRNPNSEATMTNNEIDFNKVLKPTPGSIVASYGIILAGAA